MFIRVHLDAQISGATVLVAVICCCLSELGDLLFLLYLICASYGHELYMCFYVCHAIFPEVYAMYFSKALSAVILLPCKLDATERFMLILDIFSKDALYILL